MVSVLFKKFKKKFLQFDPHTVDVLKKSIPSTGVKLGGMIVSLLVSITLGQFIGADGLGVINLSTKIVTILIVICLLGMQQVIIKEVSIAKSNNQPDHIKDVMYTGHILSFFVGLLCTVFFILLAPWISQFIFDDPRLTIPLVISLILLIPQIISRLYGSGLIGYGKIWQSNFADQTLSIFITGILLLGCVFLKVSITINRVAIIYAIGRLIVFLLMTYYWKSLDKSKVKGKFIPRKLYKMSLPLFTVTIVTVITSNADVIMVGAFLDSKSVGLYTVAARVALLTSFFLQITNASINPKIASLFYQGRILELEKMIQRTTKGLMIIGLFSVLIFVLAGDYILGLWGLEFEEAYQILIILSIGQFFNIGTGAAGGILAMCGFEKIQRNISVIFGILYLILNIIFIHLYGVYGAALATASIIIGQNLTRLIYAKSKTGISTLSFL